MPASPRIFRQKVPAKSRDRVAGEILEIGIEVAVSPHPGREGGRRHSGEIRGGTLRRTGDIRIVARAATRGRGGLERRGALEVIRIPVIRVGGIPDGGAKRQERILAIAAGRVRLERPKADPRGVEQRHLGSAAVRRDEEPRFAHGIRAQRHRRSVRGWQGAEIGRVEAGIRGRQGFPVGIKEEFIHRGEKTEVRGFELGFVVCSGEVCRFPCRAGSSLGAARGIAWSQHVIGGEIRVVAGFRERQRGQREFGSKNRAERGGGGVTGGPLEFGAGWHRMGKAKFAAVVAGAVFLVVPNQRDIPECPLRSGVDVDLAGLVIGPEGDAADDRVARCGGGHLGGAPVGAHGRRGKGAIPEHIDPLHGHGHRVVGRGDVRGDAVVNGGRRRGDGKPFDVGRGTGLVGQFPRHADEVVRVDDRGAGDVFLRLAGIGNDRPVRVVADEDRAVEVGVDRRLGFPCPAGEVCLVGGGIESAARQRHVVRGVKLEDLVGIAAVVPRADHARLGRPGQALAGIGRAGGIGDKPRRGVLDLRHDDVDGRVGELLGVLAVGIGPGGGKIRGDAGKERHDQRGDQHEHRQHDDQGDAALMEFREGGRFHFLLHLAPRMLTSELNTRYLRWRDCRVSVRVFKSCA